MFRLLQIGDGVSAVVLDFPRKFAAENDADQSADSGLNTKKPGACLYDARLA